MEHFILSNGVPLPCIGFGTYQSTDKYGQQVLEAALACGYRHFDTAVLYRNEEQLGYAIRSSGILREELFLSSKIPQNDLGYDQAKRHVEESLSRLRVEYLDLYLIHWPMENRHSATWQSEDWDTWRALEELYREGTLRAIGVCNFLPHHLMNLLSRASVAPMVNQIEFHPGYTQAAAVEFCRENRIVLEGWSPMGRGKLLSIPLLRGMAAKYQKSVAQLCIRFALQSGVVPLPKASSPQRMMENRDVFDFVISPADMSRLSTLPQCGWSGKHPDLERWAPELAAEGCG